MQHIEGSIYKYITKINNSRKVDKIKIYTIYKQNIHVHHLHLCEASQSTVDHRNSEISRYINTFYKIFFRARVNILNFFGMTKYS